MVGITKAAENIRPQRSVQGDSSFLGASTDDTRPSYALTAVQSYTSRTISLLEEGDLVTTSRTFKDI